MTLPNLLAGAGRTCRYGHGPLSQLDGAFALVGLRPHNALAGLLSPNHPRGPDGRLLALTVFRCQACGYVELIDQEP